ncbi:helix-hairpin-helix domain-containing protein [Salipaludibacillus agaradhaerens]|uniref:Helix-hairpin-helix domain-containing protein n=1 Tax=Salipaludibacillus agaradhaerens TaxID=76935 RepID=A0A9Q4FXN9_SALAG|nr:helix-hairpin-helix domain-containing protein [Salipaludibacillus agaradhaerens]MCR6096810.1 helix-hairpin-helix domain-containing protein [Salipaludibacillus agaradhaerens]MCR6113631.1 helix-hairpin-helix domain-containing protein [Salipaludibacillus agaradhaerens]
MKRFIHNRLLRHPIYLVGAIIAISTIIIILFVTSRPAEKEQVNELTAFWEEENGEKVNEKLEEITQDIIVDIKGEVAKPGIYKVEPDERVNNVITKAGGFTSEANVDVINLAERCYDEMVIVVPSYTDVEEGEFSHLTVNSSEDEGGVFLNEATLDELTSLPGIGPAKAEAIISYREEHGLFQAKEDILNVPGIGEKTLETLEDYLIIK